jgi:hypothetical protein
MSTGIQMSTDVGSPATRRSSVWGCLAGASGVRAIFGAGSSSGRRLTSGGK